MSHPGLVDRRGRSQDAAAERTRGLRMWIAGGIAFALVTTIAVIASGYDARETPREDASVWVARDAGQYARVNTDTGELDIVRKASDVSGLLQFGGRGVVLSNGNGRAWPIEASNPVDLGDAAKPKDGVQTVGNESNEQSSEKDGASAVRMPEGTRAVVASGRFVGVLTEPGSAYFGELSGDPDSNEGSSADAKFYTADLSSRLASLRQMNPFAEEQAKSDKVENKSTSKTKNKAGNGEAEANEKDYHADAIAVSATGEVALYSSEENAVRRFDGATGEFRGTTDSLPDAAKGLVDPQLTLVGSDWVLVDAERGRLWRKDSSETKLSFEGEALLQTSSAAQSNGDVLVADAGGLWRVGKGGKASREAEAKGTPAQPVEVAGKMYAAWLGQSGGSLWQDGELKPLQFDNSIRQKGDLNPTFRTNGERAVLSEMRTGMLWTLPEGTLIPLAQWNISDPPKEDRGTVVVDEVTEQLPPVAVDDSFGVRAGQQAPLPVMLNDYDPNKRDVLTIIPESLTESPLPEAFGTVQLMPDGQSLTVQMVPEATGTATFSYRITDGGLSSETATVTLTVMGDEANTAPAWCPVEGCQREWRVPAITPGGTLVYPILEGWVDPEGDVLMLSGAEVVNPDDPVRAIVTNDGKLAVRHTDPNAGASEVMLRITVADDRGQQQQRNLQLSVQPNAPAEFIDTAATVRVGEPVTLQPLQRVAGGSGSYALTNATVQSGSNVLQLNQQLASGTIEVEATETGSAMVALNIRDTVTGGEITGMLRVTATPEGASLALPPLRAFVRPLSDSTVNVLDAISGASDRSLSVTAANVVEGELRADVIEHAQVRVAGSTADGAPGRIGAVDVTVAEGVANAQGRLTVFQVPETGGDGAIAVADVATVRAGSITDIRVLDNDVAPPGTDYCCTPRSPAQERRVSLLSPRVTCCAILPRISRGSTV
ncbi:hypothetical protein G7066_13670 [Leucobacter coleopterorum]|uniref:Uncharacterized protein n=1 Tax=Leucobacter coleopterorum TaxID=2714933 RepID=A0ABX6JYG1_9MICO|nr:Ig-like domain-containing protein [Leucobacter coleopterorum]QIM19360.1 hypothetical protein G7066_13670 [Leucobacter coleopterorum]